MSEFILNEAEVSGNEGSDGEIMDVQDDLADFKIGDEFIDDNSVDEDFHFYHRKNNNRIVSDDDKYEEEEEGTVYEIPNSENAIKNTKSNFIDNMHDEMQVIYSTDEYKWNYYKLPRGSIYEFPNEKHFMKWFHSSLLMATKDNESVNSFLPSSKKYVGILDKNPYNFEFLDNSLKGEDDSHKILQSKDCLFLNLLYGLRFALTEECSHATDFSCLDQDMVAEVNLIKPQIEFDFANARFTDKLHLINDTIIRYGFFLKLYVIQIKFRCLNLADQEKLKRQNELTFEKKKIIYLFIFLLIVLPVSNTLTIVIFLKILRALLLLITWKKVSTLREKKLTNATIAMFSLGTRESLTSMSNTVQVAWDSFTLFMMIESKVTETTLNTRRIFHLQWSEIWRPPQVIFLK